MEFNSDIPPPTYFRSDICTAARNVKEQHPSLWPVLLSSLAFLFAMTFAGHLFGQSRPPVQQPPLPAIQVTATKPDPITPPYFGSPPPAPFVPISPVITLPDIDQGDLCEEIKAEYAPPQSDKWCRSDYTSQRRANEAVQEFIQQLATDSRYGPDSGLGMLHEFLRHPLAQLQAPRGSAAGQIIQLIGNALALGQVGGTPDWGLISGQISAACFSVEIAVTGRPINIDLQTSTESCVRAAGILRMESQGVPFNSAHNQTWLDGISVSIGAGVAVGADLGTLLTRLLDAAGFKEGLKTTSSLNAVNDFINHRLQSCDRYLKKMKEAGCPAP